MKKELKLIWSLLLLWVTMYVFCIVYFSNHAIAERYYKNENYTQAIEYYTKACIGKNPQSCSKLSYIYYDGTHIRKSLYKSTSYKYDACIYGDSSSCITLYYYLKECKIIYCQEIKSIAYEKYGRDKFLEENNKNISEKMEDKLIQDVIHKILEEGYMKMTKNGNLRFPNHTEMIIDSANKPSFFKILKKAI